MEHVETFDFAPAVCVSCRGSGPGVDTGTDLDDALTAEGGGAPSRVYICDGCVTLMAQAAGWVPGPIHAETEADLAAMAQQNAELEAERDELDQVVKANLAAVSSDHNRWERMKAKERTAGKREVLRAVQADIKSKKADYKLPTLSDLEDS